MSDKAHVISDIDAQGIGTIEFYHPQSNSLPGNILAQLASAISDFGKNPSCKVIILKSGGNRTFCAGASFSELAAIQDPIQGKQFFLGFANVINACRTCTKIVLGRIQGKAVGGGVGVASAVDICRATKYAAFRLSELAIGIGPFVVGPAVERKVGTSAFQELTLSPTEWKTPEHGKTIGLYTELYDSAEEMDEAIAAHAKELASYNPEALKALKEAFWMGTENWGNLLDERAAMSGELVLSEFTKQAIDRFRNSRA